MIRVNRKKIAIISLLFLIIVIELLALGLSSAEKTKEINMKIIDSQGKLEDFSVTINAFDGGKSGYYITLPERVNGILVKNYLISKKEIITDEETVKNITTENLVESYNIEEDVNVDNNNTQNTTNTTEEILQIVKMQAGDRVYLTKEELENTEITIKVEYDLKEIAEETLYNNRISLEAEKEIKLEIQGYLPTTVKIKNKEINEEIGALISKEINQSEVTIVDVYNLELLKDEKAYEITDENSIQIILSKLDATKKYKIYKWTNNKVQEITEITKLENTISFMNSKLEPIIVCTKNERDTINSINLTDYLPKLLANKSLFETQALNTWDGNVSSGFKFGDGTESNPYLISTGDELAYLAGQVNAGTTYQGNYFQIAADIDINGKTWTPIGNTNNSFRGVLDGAGHTIANAVINITSESNNIETYGFFGTIGGGNSETIIKNIEFNNIKVDFNVTREINSNNYGYKIGIVAGAIYNNAGIKNVSVKNSQIIHNGTLTAIYNQSWSNTTYYAPILFVGGIAGDTVYSSTNENTSSYAWFTANQTVTVSQLQVNVAAQNGLQISADGSVFSALIGKDDLITASGKYTDLLNQLPVNLAPVSTGKNVTDGKMDMYLGTVNANATSGKYELTATKETEINSTTTEAQGKFLAFDIFLKVESKTNIELTANSGIKATGAKSTGIENAARIAFVVQGNKPAGTDLTTIQQMNAGQVYIWEPNYDTHTPAAISHAIGNYNKTLADFGLTSMPSATQTNAEQILTDGVKAEITTGILLPDTTAAANGTFFTTITPDYKTKSDFGKNGTDKLPIFTLEPGITKIRVYCWIEGQDYDCENDASGGNIALDLQITRSETQPGG